MKLADAAEYYEFSGLHKSPATQRWITARLSYFITWCASQGIAELSDLKPLYVQKYLDGLARGEYAMSGKALSSYTVNGHGRIIRAWLNWCVKNPDLHHEVKPHLPKSLNLPKVRIKVIEHFTTEQLDRLLAACSKECHPQLIYRDRAIITLLRDTGIRASELCSLTLDQVYLDPAESFIRVIGKGNREREVGLTKDARAALYRYIHRYRRAHADEKSVFTNQRNQQLTPNGLDQTLYRLRDWAHITGVRCSAHTFRHSFADGKIRTTDTANTDDLLRIVQSIPSPKAEPFKRWLAKVGTERIQEDAQPGLAEQRLAAKYRKKGYPDDWIERRLQGMIPRADVVGEWVDRGASAGRQIAALTDRLNVKEFGLTTREHKEYKGLPLNADLRDSETGLELLITALGEETAATLHRDRDTQGFRALGQDCDEAGDAAHRASLEIEKTTGKPVLSRDNYKELQQGRQRELQPPLFGE